MQLVKGQRLQNTITLRQAVVLAPANPKYVMIEWTDTHEKEVPFIEWMDELVLVN